MTPSLRVIITEALFRAFPGRSRRPAEQASRDAFEDVFLAYTRPRTRARRPACASARRETSGGRTRASALEDVFEALVGALYLDSDLPTTRTVVLKLYGPLPDRLAGTEDTGNPKGQLPGICAAAPRCNTALRYEVTQVEERTMRAIMRWRRSSTTARSGAAAGLEETGRGSGRARNAGDAETGTGRGKLNHGKVARESQFARLTGLTIGLPGIPFA